MCLVVEMSGHWLVAKIAKRFCSWASHIQFSPSPPLNFLNQTSALRSRREAIEEARTLALEAFRVALDEVVAREVLSENNNNGNDNRSGNAGDIVPKPHVEVLTLLASASASLILSRFAALSPADAPGFEVRV